MDNVLLSSENSKRNPPLIVVKKINPLKNIVDCWNIDARKEKPEYFYSYGSVENICSGKKSFVIARKGMGKTAIAEYITKNHKENEKVDNLSLLDFPINKMYGFKDTGFNTTMQYITVWKYVIYNSVCRMLLQSDSIDPITRKGLEAHYNTETDPVKAFEALLPDKKWMPTGGGLSFLKSGANVSGTIVDNSTDWIALVGALYSFLKSLDDKNKYYILIDELDEIYSFGDNEERTNYFNLLASLFRAVNSISTEFSNADISIKIYPVVFLRDDIFAQIRDADKTKWNSRIEFLKWDKGSMMEMLCYRLQKSVTQDVDLKRSASWNYFFSTKEICCGNERKNKISIFDYIAQHTHMRPRDFIEYIRCCARIAYDNGENIISPETVKKARDEYSINYFYEDLKSEAYVEIDNIDSIMEILGQIRKKEFDPNDFISIYKERNPECSDAEIQQILKKLFNFSIIGNEPSMHDHHLFKYNNPRITYNTSEHVIVHKGLYKALQILLCI